MVREESEFIVIGAGLLGLATGSALARRGREVLVLEQAAAGHPGSGSKGSCRIFRRGYRHPEYVDLTGQARELWSELERASGQRLLSPAAQLTFGTAVDEVREAMRAAGAPCELLSGGEAARRFPGVSVPGPVLAEPESCVIDAAAALRALATAVPAMEENRGVTGIRDDGRRVTVTTGAGPLTCRAAVVCAGPWTAGLLAPAGITLPSTATQEQVAYLPPGDGRADGLPILVEFGGRGFYGLPVPGEPLYKAGLHHGGPQTDPARQDQDPDPGLSRLLAADAARYLPALPRGPVSAERCVYDNTPDEDFVVGRAGNVVIGSGTSGHGFKFGPLFGDWLASLATGGAGRSRVPRRFRPGRFSAAGTGNR